KLIGTPLRGSLLGRRLFFSRHDEVHHQALLASRLERVLPVDELASVILQPGDRLGATGLAPFGVERLAVEDNLLPVEPIAALAHRHPFLSGVGPEAGESTRFGLEPDNPESGRRRAALLEDEIRLQEPALVDHGLMASPLRPDGLSGAGVEG